MLADKKYIFDQDNNEDNKNIMCEHASNMFCANQHTALFTRGNTDVILEYEILKYIMQVNFQLNQQ